VLHFSQLLFGLEAQHACDVISAVAELMVDIVGLEAQHARVQSNRMLLIADHHPLTIVTNNHAAPSEGVDFGSKDATKTSWSAQAATQLDYFITVPAAGTVGSARGQSIMHSYVDAVGHSPMLPAYAAGYWHSRNRYSNQQVRYP
jgi:alpha-glucosidase (family GH31 glycosyl hydrolase)